MRRVSQEADPLLLLPLFCHLESQKVSSSAQTLPVRQRLRRTVGLPLWLWFVLKPTFYTDCISHTRRRLQKEPARQVGNSGAQPCAGLSEHRLRPVHQETTGKARGARPLPRPPSQWRPDSPGGGGFLLQQPSERAESVSGPRPGRLPGPRSPCRARGSPSTAYPHLGSPVGGCLGPPRGFGTDFCIS